MVRSQSVWNATKSMLIDSGAALTYELTKAAASTILRARLGLPVLAGEQKRS
jgi:hypothetical protein